MHDVQPASGPGHRDVQVADTPGAGGEDAGGFDEDLDALEDWALWGKYLPFGDFRLIARVTSIYHIPADPGARTARQQMLRAAHAKVRSRIRRGG